MHYSVMHCIAVDCIALCCIELCVVVYGIALYCIVTVLLLMCTRIIYFIKIATYDVAVLGIRFRYFMVHKFNPRTNTFTWTLDYDRSSDFDDNVGHWQVMRHPSKNGWSRYVKEYTSTE